jgi:hypothetical protein
MKSHKVETTGNSFIFENQFIHSCQNLEFHLFSNLIAITEEIRLNSFTHFLIEFYIPNLVKILILCNKMIIFLLWAKAKVKTGGNQDNNQYSSVSL